jgi:hypothetical protein
MDKLGGSWNNNQQINSRQYVCGHCGNDISSNLGFKCFLGPNDFGFIYICHYCNRPTFFNVFGDPVQVPGPILGLNVEHLPHDINQLYNEIRMATSVDAFTAAVLGEPENYLCM